MVVLLIIVKKWKQHECPSTKEWMNKMWHIHTKEYSVQRKNEVLIHATTQMSLENIVLHERSQT
jgi:hypothetical protein